MLFCRLGSEVFDVCLYLGYYGQKMTPSIAFVILYQEGVLEGNKSKREKDENQGIRRAWWLLVYQWMLMSCFYS